jgi:hypothetical protein
MAPRFPEEPLQSLPPILRMIYQVPIPDCSKGSRGLSVLPRVCGIFTTSTISPSPLSRQCTSRYAVHAGRNLPDKELRYLRTVIVTAAVYRGFSRQLLRHLIYTLNFSVFYSSNVCGHCRSSNVSHVFSHLIRSYMLHNKLNASYHFWWFYNHCKTYDLRLLFSSHCCNRCSISLCLLHKVHIHNTLCISV